MMSGVNPRQMQAMMKKMGITQQELDAEVVIIKLSDNREIIIRNPSVQKVNMMGQKNYQISGDEEVVTSNSMPELSEEDVKTVAEQASVSEEKARQAIIKAKGDLAQAILDLQ